MSKRTSAVCWPKISPATTQQPAGKSKRASWIQFVVMIAVGGILYGYFDHRIAGIVVWSLSALLLSGILFFDAVLRGFEKTGQFLAHYLSTGMTWLLLTPLYFIVFGLGGVFLRLASKDPMRRKWDPQSKSYWIPHRKLDIESRYKKQF